MSASSDAKRFRPTVALKQLTALQSYTVAQMEESPNGEYVLASDYAALRADAERYRWLRSTARARFADTLPLEPQLIYTKRGDPFINGFAKRVDAAVDTAINTARRPECPACGGHGVVRHEGSLDIVDDCRACLDCRPEGAP